MKTEVEKTLEFIGFNPRDENGEIRSADDLVEEVMDLLEHYSGVGKMYILAMIRISRIIDEDTHYLYPERFKED